MDTYPEYRKPPTQPPPPKPRKEGQYTTEVILAMVVVIVVVSVVVGLFMYIFIPKPIAGYNCCEPNVQFSAAEASGPNEWIVQVAGVSEPYDYDNFGAVLLRNGVRQGEAMSPLQVTTVGNITFTDIDGGGRLTVGDYFSISTIPNSTYRLVIIWMDSGNERGFVEWET
jgi:hypothetical protein